MIEPDQDHQNTIKVLQSRIDELEKEISFLKEHTTIQAGIRGETLIADLVSGQLARKNAHHDIEANGLLIEVKYSRLNIPNKTAATKRWTWTKVLGMSGRKIYDYVILVGDVDERYRDLYDLDTGSPYIAFVVKREDVDEFLISSNSGLIQLTTNPPKATSKGSKLFAKHQFKISSLEKLEFIR